MRWQHLAFVANIPGMIDIPLDEIAWLATDGMAALLLIVAVVAWWRWR